MVYNILNLYTVAHLLPGRGYTGYPDTPALEENNNTYNTFYNTEEIIWLLRSEKSNIKSMYNSL